VETSKTATERYTFPGADPSGQVTSVLSLVARLHDAIEHEEFLLYYQPTVDVDTRKVAGLEALIRWRSPQQGMVNPADFIPVLEETGMILEVGRWALRQATADQARWAALGLAVPRVAVNVSAVELRQPDFVESVRDTLDGNRLIDLEITESRIMEDVGANVDKFRRLHALGVGIAIDDFGTGYSSLAYLAKLPVQTLKIAREFISRMLEDDETMAVVQTIISLAQALKLSTVAEGVESEEQADFLALLRCNRLQGNIAHKPLPPQEVATLLGSPFGMPR
jgi:EAL domain-containing protein (putative c-di-GMP-specific phosphodiesterase class I)